MQEQVGDITFEVKNHYQAELSRLDTDYNFVRGGVTETRTSRHHVYTAAEIGRMLEEAGLEVRKCYGGVDGEPFEACDDVKTVQPGCGIGFELALLLPFLMWLRRRRGLRM